MVASGKTLCMFLPPLTMSATSIGVVISPLNAIMDEQVLYNVIITSQLKLKQVGVSATRILNSDMKMYAQIESAKCPLGK